MQKLRKMRAALSASYEQSQKSEVARRVHACLV